jgi:hypothetical protein
MSKVTDFVRSGTPVVIAPVGESDRGGDEFLGTVALVRTGAQINIGLKADGSTVATSRVRFRHYRSPNGPWIQIISLMATHTE